MISLSKELLLKRAKKLMVVTKEGDSYALDSMSP